MITRQNTKCAAEGRQAGGRWRRHLFRRQHQQRHAGERLVLDAHVETITIANGSIPTAADFLYL
jgi:hypothetical protein